MNVVYHREAEAELIVAAQYYESKVPDLGAGFLDEIDAALQRIQKNPDAFPVVEDDIRRLSMIPRFRPPRQSLSVARKTS